MADHPHSSSHQSGSGAARGNKSGGLPKDKTASWPGLPGKKQPKDRGVGVPKIKQAVLEDF